MVALCSNRPEGFGPSSTLASPLPTSCFNDVILIPLPTWIYLATLSILFLVAIQNSRSNFNPSTTHIKTVPVRSLPRTILTVIYYLFMVASILMQILEIVRLELINHGIGLLPFSFVAILLVFASHVFVGVRRILEPRLLIGVNVLLWTSLMVMSAVKTAALHNEESNGETRVGSRYPINDQIVDLGVMAGVYAVLAILEVVVGLWRERAARPHVLAETDSLEVGSMDGKNSEGLTDETTRL